MTTTPPAGPPEAARHADEHVEHGVTRPDPYSWLREVDSPEVLAHLVAERTWYDVATGHLTLLRETLRSEMEARTAPTDTSVGWRHGGFSYYTRLPAGRDYPQLLRDLHTSTGHFPRDPEAQGTDVQDSASAGRVLLDANELAGDSAYVELGLVRVSPDDRLLAYSVDVVGDEVYRLRFRDLETAEDLPDVVERSYYGGAWGADSRTFYYTVHDEAYRPYQLWRHVVGTPATDDRLVLEEPDERFELAVRPTRSGDLVVAWVGSRDTTEVWVLDAHDPSAEPRSVGGRRAGVEYHAEHLRTGDGTGVLLVVTNDGAQEFRLAQTPVPRDADQTSASWTPLVEEDPAVRLERADAFAGHVVLTERTAGRRRLRVLKVSSGSSGVGGSPDVGPVELVESTAVAPLFPAGTVSLGPNADYEASTLVVGDQSYVHPCVWSEVDPDTGARAERHRREAPGHEPERYVCEVMTFPAPDGTAVPATVVRRRDVPLDGTAPGLLYGYGAYEYSFEPEWDAALPSLLDRGVVFVHAHVRGGGEGGRRWWLEGRLEHKQNTFSDHAAVADGLADGVLDGSRLATRGLSAGGLLQGAVFSQRPDRWAAVVAEVPFVDVVTTMLDPSIPLTVNEWDEWGDPRREADFRWMLAYSPYDNLPEAGSRPDLLVTAAVHDSRVMVWEPAKWVAALRASDPEWSPRCLFRCETGAGAHAGPSGRFARYAYESELYAWLLDRLGAAPTG